MYLMEKSEIQNQTMIFNQNKKISWGENDVHY